MGGFRRNKRGVTLTELMVTVAIMGILSVMGSMMFSRMMQYFLRAKVRNQMNNEARITMDLATKFIRQGKSDSISICSCPTTDCASCVSPPASAPPNCRLEFDLYNGTNVKLYWSNQQAFMQLGTQSAKALSSYVTYMNFALDPSDPTLMNMNLRLDRVVDAKQTETLFLPNQQIRMMGSSETK